MQKRRNKDLITEGRMSSRAMRPHRDPTTKGFVTISLFGDIQSADQVVSVVTRAIQHPRVNPGGSNDRTIPKGGRSQDRGRGRKQVGRELVDTGRWPLDLIGGGYGMLALKVWPNAGLESVGLFDDDLIVIRIGDAGGKQNATVDPSDDDIRDGDPVFAVIDNQVMIGWWSERAGGRIEIVPFNAGSRNVVADAADVKVVFRLEALARRS